MATPAAPEPSRCGWKTILWGVTLGVAGWLLLPCVLFAAVWLGDGTVGWPLADMPVSVLLWIVLIPGGIAVCRNLMARRSLGNRCLLGGLAGGLVVTPILGWLAMVIFLVEG